jgi:hypothetical protein
LTDAYLVLHFEHCAIFNFDGRAVVEKEQGPVARDRYFDIAFSSLKDRISGCSVGLMVMGHEW